jgi:hypothetical protein
MEDAMTLDRTPRLRRAALSAVAALALAAASAQASAGAQDAPGDVTFGPYVLPHLPDFTTCGTPWERGHLSHQYHVHARLADGSYLISTVGVVHGRSLAGTSIGACDNGQPNDGATVGAGIAVRIEFRGLFHVTGGTLNPDATCADPCLPPDFAAAVFGPDATITQLSWTGTYTTQCNGAFFYSLDPSGAEHDVGDITGARAAC